MERKAPRTLEETLNDVLLTLAKRDTKQRENNARKTPNIEVVLEISMSSVIDLTDLLLIGCT
jgi:hypothetical protein